MNSMLSVSVENPKEFAGFAYAAIFWFKGDETLSIS